MEVQVLSPELHRLITDARVDQLRREAAAARIPASLGRPRAGWRRRRRAPATMLTIEPSVTIRYAFSDDARALATLAALDSCDPPAQPMLIAEVEGELLAALSLADGAVIADPFRRTAGLVELLEARAAQLASRLDATGSGVRSAGLASRASHRATA
jgi:hypothetical protein